MLFSLADLAYGLYPLVPLPVLCAFARLQGRLRYRARRGEREIVRHNLESAFGRERGDGDLDRLTRQAFEQRQLRGLMLALLPRLRQRRTAALFRIDGLEHLDRAVSQGGGAILVASHLNSLCNFMAVELLRARGYDIQVAMPVDADPQPPTAFRKAFDRLTGAPSFRERVGTFFAQFNLRPILRRLADDSAVVFVGDGWHSAAFAKVDFLDRPLYFTTGPMGVARLSGSPVVPLFAVGTLPDKMRFVFEEPISSDPELDSRADVERMVTLFAGRLEHHLRENIPCWQHWFEEKALETMASLPESSLADRYQLRPDTAAASAS